MVTYGQTRAGSDSVRVDILAGTHGSLQVVAPALGVARVQRVQERAPTVVLVVYGPYTSNIGLLENFRFP
jgi:hypothetical protein